MNWRALWPPWCRHRAEDQSEDAQDRLDAMNDQSDAIEKLGKNLREQGKRNNFGPMVQEAIRRAPRPGEAG